MTDIQSKYEQINLDRQNNAIPNIGDPNGMEQTCSDGIGRFQHYQTGESIYWHSDTGAHLIYGLIKGKWNNLGWERSVLGYPNTDEENAGSGGGRFNSFQHGTLIWKSGTGEAFSVSGPILDKWAVQNWDGGALGFPLNDERIEIDSSGIIRKQDFEGGQLTQPINEGDFIKGAMNNAIYKIEGAQRHLIPDPSTLESMTVWDKVIIISDYEVNTIPEGSPIPSVIPSEQVRVSGFLPSVNGFHFQNSFPHAADVNINFFGADVAIGDAANGLCGGMIYAVRDIFEAGMLPPADSVSPTNGSVFDYIVKRLFDSFDLPLGPFTYLAYMDPALPDHETDASKIGITSHGRAWIMIMNEWPKIKNDLDSGMLSTMALVEVRSFNPGDLGQNHQVLAYGYDLKGNDLKILIYDPNCPNNDGITLSLNIGDPFNTTPINSTCYSGGDLNCFFRSNYNFFTPPSFTPAPADATVQIFNNTRVDQVVRVFNPDDVLMLIALTAGEFIVYANQENSWVFQAGIGSVKLTANGRPLGIAMPNDNITINQDDSILIRNLFSDIVKVKFFNVDDKVMWVTLPNGDCDVSPDGDSLSYIVPPDLNTVKAIINNQTFTANLGDVFIVNTDGNVVTG